MYHISEYNRSISSGILDTFGWVWNYCFSICNRVLWRCFCLFCLVSKSAAKSTSTQIHNFYVMLNIESWVSQLFSQFYWFSALLSLLWCSENSNRINRNNLLIRSWNPMDFSFKNIRAKRITGRSSAWQRRLWFHVF